MLGHDVRRDLAMACRVLAAHRIIDLWGHLSMRIPRSEHILITPRFDRRVLPRGIRSSDMLVVTIDGEVVDGEGELPVQIAADLALYRKDPTAGACICFSPRYAMAAAIADYRLKPMTHMEAFVAFGLGTWESEHLAVEPAPADDLAGLLASSVAAQQPGIASWAKGESLLHALMAAYHLEYLGQQNFVAAQLDVVEHCREEDSRKMWHQFAGWDHYVEFFRSLDPGPLPHPAAALHEARSLQDPAEETARIKEQTSLACKTLWERDTLVAFLEHVSHRLPGENRMIISAAKNFGLVGPGDMCVLDLEANWIDGPRPPGFKWFHAQILSERPDVQAIVHTHDLYGRSYALSRHELHPIYRVGLTNATRPLPVYPRCDLIVDKEVRRETLDLLGDGPIVHEACHGTDFVADSLEYALVDAIQREQFLEMDSLARRFGSVHAMPTRLENVAAAEAGHDSWWWFHTAEIAAPRRSVGGL